MGLNNNHLNNLTVFTDVFNLYRRLTVEFYPFGNRESPTKT